VGTRQEPTFDVAAIEVLTYYRSPHFGTKRSQVRSLTATERGRLIAWTI
jgi:hypothetical protein